MKRRDREDIRKILKEYVETAENYTVGSIFITDIARALGIQYSTTHKHILYMYEHSMLDPRIVYTVRGRNKTIFFRHYLPVEQSIKTEKNYEGE
jgi:response regulator of citrate/malate metabolism